MTEIDLLRKSTWRWIDLFESGDTLMASGFTAWAGIFWASDVWHAVGFSKDNGAYGKLSLIGSASRMVALAQAEDFLNTHESDDTAKKTKRWLSDPASAKQLELLRIDPHSDQAFTMSKYRASCLINFRFNQGKIINLVERACRSLSMAA